MAKLGPSAINPGTQSLRITIVNRYFWPESVLVNEISAWLVEDGHEVMALTCQPDYNPEARHGIYPAHEIRKGVNIWRVNRLTTNSRGMVRDLISLFFVAQAALIVLFGRRCDAVWSTSFPPIVQPFLLRLASWARGAKFVYFPQDIYPEIATSMGLMREGLMSRFLKAVDTWNLDKADVVVTISNDMVDSIRSRGAKPAQLEVIRSFSPVEQARPAPKAGLKRPLRFVFAGNIGRFQNLDGLIEAFAPVDPDEVVLEFLGDGWEKARLMEVVATRGIRSVKFHPSVSVEAAFAFVKNCDVGVVSLAPSIYRYAFPAKTYTYLGACLPLLVFVEHDSELSAIVRDLGIGEAVSWDDPEATVKTAIARLIANYSSYQARVYSDTDDLHLTGNARSNWLRLFAGLAAGQVKDQAP